MQDYKDSTMAAQEAVEAIFKVVEKSDTEGVVRMLDEDPRLLSTTWEGGSLLMRAARRAHVDLVRLLLDRGAEINFASASGATALWIAARNDREEVVSLLLRSGADASRRLNHGTTALGSACVFGYVTVVQRLLQHTRAHTRGRVLGNRDDGGRTALWLASINGYAEIVRLLLLAGRTAPSPTRTSDKGRLYRLQRNVNGLNVLPCFG
jgi:ankyrin repeat protein